MPLITNRRFFTGLVWVAVSLAGPPQGPANGGELGPESRSTSPPLGRILAPTFLGGLSGNFVYRDGVPLPPSPALVQSAVVDRSVVTLYSVELMTRPTFSGLAFPAPISTIGDGYSSPVGNGPSPSRVYIDRGIRVEEYGPNDLPPRAMVAPKP